MDSSPSIVVLILCGGVGTRLWPLSNAALPKQFAPILSGRTLFEHTVERNREISSRIMIAANAAQAQLAFAQMEELGIHEHFGLIEAVGRNTAAAITLSTMLMDPESIVMVVPSDHVITKTEAYRAIVQKAIDVASLGRIVTFGITPEYPETGYGYIEASADGNDPWAVQSFREKPDAETASEYLKAGNYYWNSGMFCFKARVFLEELHIHAPNVYTACLNAFQEGGGEASREKLLPWQPATQYMEEIPSISVDYALMERSKRIAMLPCAIGWNDLGTFEALRDYYQKNTHGSVQDSNGNLALSQSEPMYIDSKRNMIMSDRRQVVLVDIDDLMVVETTDSLLICRNGSGQKVKHAGEKFANNSATEGMK